jgi:hypothetical protein
MKLREVLRRLTLHRIQPTRVLRNEVELRILKTLLCFRSYSETLWKRRSALDASLPKPGVAQTVSLRNDSEGLALNGSEPAQTNSLRYAEIEAKNIFF